MSVSLKKKTEAFPSVILIKGDEPMAETEFYKWLEQVKPERFVEAIKGFYPDFAFGYHFLTEEQLDRHKMVYDHFWWSYYHKGKGWR